PQRQVEGAARNHLEVVGAIEGCGGVERAATSLDHREVLPRLDMSGTLEHEVLEEMRESLPVWLLVARTDVVPEIDRHQAEARRWADHDAKAVVESPAEDRV